MDTSFCGKKQVPKLVKKVCTVKIWGKGVERGLGVSWTRRKWRKTAAGEANSGDEILWPGGTVRRGMKGGKTEEG